MTETEQKIADLHQWYCERTGLHTKLIFSQRLWYEMLKNYDFKKIELYRDADLIIRYLMREIAREKRNMGALKLSNFLQPDNFDSDLALARLKFTQRSRRIREDIELAEAQERDDKETHGEIARQLREFRKSLGKPAGSC